jgi:dienelactone hydrolase
MILLWQLWLATAVVAQPLPPRRTPAEFGFRHLVVMFGRDSVDVLVQSPKGAESQKRPLLLWVQGSLPKPVILYDERGPYGVFPFVTKSSPPNCHLVVIGKPGIPVVADLRTLDASKSFVDKTTRVPPLYYCQRNYLDYYVRRNQAVLRYLKKQPWVDAKNVTVAGHSEGSTIAAHLAAVPGLVNRAVYLSGNPLGRMMSNVAEARQDQAAGDTAAVPQMYRYWREVVAAPTRTDCTPGDHNRATYEFSAAPLTPLLRARVPLFVGFGSLDKGIAGDDYLRLEALRLHKSNFTFREYAGREHNFFGVKNGQINYDDFYWDRVGEDFLRWAGLLR